jgi:hypothetical protein
MRPRIALPYNPPPKGICHMRLRMLSVGQTLLSVRTDKSVCRTLLLLVALIALPTFAATPALSAVEGFDESFTDKTMRLDYFHT